MNKCKCGCGQEVTKENNIYINGHNTWNKGKKGLQKHSEKTKELMSNNRSGEKNSMYGKKQTEETKEKIRNKRLGKKASEETRKLMSNKRRGKSINKGKIPWNKGKEFPEIKGEKNGNWVGGCYNYLHEKAWELFGNKKCEICGITNEDHIKQYGKRLHMHCGSHKYSLLEKSNWLCCCNTCHGKLEE